MAGCSPNTTAIPMADTNVDYCTTSHWLLICVVFRQNVANGNNAVVLNSEFRLPVLPHY